MENRLKAGSYSASISKPSTLILVETKGQKIIVIGDKGARLKSIGTKAQEDIEELIGRKVFLQLWLKVKSSWPDSETSLKNLGYDPNGTYLSTSIKYTQRIN